MQLKLSETFVYYCWRSISRDACNYTVKLLLVRPVRSPLELQWTMGALFCFLSVFKFCVLSPHHSVWVGALLPSSNDRTTEPTKATSRGDESVVEAVERQGAPVMYKTKTMKPSVICEETFPAPFSCSRRSHSTTERHAEDRSSADNCVVDAAEEPQGEVYRYS
jgi:hypothetical protein